MRIITGAARGRRLMTLQGDAVRPTPERVKEALFSMLQFQLEGRRVLDLFAGSGQIGLEALSRGAREAVFRGCIPGKRQRGGEKYPKYRTEPGGQSGTHGFAAFPAEKK